MGLGVRSVWTGQSQESLWGCCEFSLSFPALKCYLFTWLVWFQFLIEHWSVCFGPVPMSACMLDLTLVTLQTPAVNDPCQDLLSDNAVKVMNFHSVCVCVFVCVCICRCVCVCVCVCVWCLYLTVECCCGYRQSRLWTEPRSLTMPGT